MWYKINKVRPLSQAAVFMSTTEAELLVKVKEKVKALFSESLPPIVCQHCAETDMKLQAQQEFRKENLSLAGDPTKVPTI